MSIINKPHIDWTLRQNCEKMREALSAARNDFGKTYPILIDGHEYNSSALIQSIDPACKSRSLGSVYVAHQWHVNRAAIIANNCWTDWKKMSGEKRGDILLKAAEIIDAKKFELAALLVYEISKPWDEAMGEIEEAIDFIRLYALAAVEYNKETRRQPEVRSENNYTKYISRGITAAISSWNFPFSLLIEKIASSLAAGCPVLVKPAEQAPIIGWHAVKYFLEAGVLPGTIAYLSGGADTGKLITGFIPVAQITFTGSKEVGLSITRSAAETSVFGFRRVDLETGGNNAMIICLSADLDKAIEDIMHSKFSFNGQKCSALQRLIIVGKPHDERVSNLLERISIESLIIGHPENPEVTLTALIDEDARISVNKKIRTFNDMDKNIICRERRDAPVDMGAFVNPVIFSNIPNYLMNHEIIGEEIFGPALFVFCLPNLEEAVKFANFSKFGLTAGIHTELEEDVNYFVENISAGNIYVRRPIVGAMVDRQPFGGIKFSGMGHKVGTAERLKFYLDEISVSKNLLSHGMLT